MNDREPACYALLILGLVLLITATITYQNALQLECEPHLFFAADWETQTMLPYITAKRFQPILGSAGCACLFAVPGLLVLAFGFWNLRRWCK